MRGHMPVHRAVPVMQAVAFLHSCCSRAQRMVFCINFPFGSILFPRRLALKSYQVLVPVALCGTCSCFFWSSYNIDRASRTCVSIRVRCTTPTSRSSSRNGQLSSLPKALAEVDIRFKAVWSMLTKKRVGPSYGDSNNTVFITALLSL